MEGGIVMGLTAALKGPITIDEGRVQQSNFHDYPLLRLDEMPAVEVYLVPSNRPPRARGRWAYRRPRPRWPTPFSPPQASECGGCPSGLKICAERDGEGCKHRSYDLGLLE